MLTPWILKSLRAALMTEAAKAEDAQTLATDSLNQYRDILTLTDPLTQLATWYPFSIMEYEAGLGRVLLSASVGNNTVGWKTPMWPGIDLPASVSIRRGALANAKVFVGGGSGELLQGTIILTMSHTLEDAKAIDRDTFGSFAETPNGLAVVEYALPDSGLDAETFETSYWEWLYLVHQVRAIMSSEDALPQGCRRVMVANTTFSQYHQPQQWTFRADVAWYVEMRV